MGNEKISNLLDSTYELDQRNSLLERINLVNKKEIVDILKSKDDLDLEVEEIDDLKLLLNVILTKVGQEEDFSDERFNWFKSNVINILGKIDIESLKSILGSDEFKNNSNVILFVLNLIKVSGNENLFPILEMICDFEIVKNNSLVFMLLCKTLSNIQLLEVVDIYIKLLSFNLEGDQLLIHADSVIDYFLTNNKGFAITFYLGVYCLFGVIGIDKEKLNEILFIYLNKFKEYNNLIEDYDNESLIQIILKILKVYIDDNSRTKHFVKIMCDYVEICESNEPLNLNINELDSHKIGRFLKYSFFEKDKKKKILYTINSTNQVGVSYIFEELLDNVFQNICSLDGKRGMYHCAKLIDVVSNRENLMHEFVSENK